MTNDDKQTFCRLEVKPDQKLFFLIVRRNNVQDSDCEFITFPNDRENENKEWTLMIFI